MSLLRPLLLNLIFILHDGYITSRPNCEPCTGKLVLQFGQVILNCELIIDLLIAFFKAFGFVLNLILKLDLFRISPPFKQIL